MKDGSILLHGFPLQIKIEDAIAPLPVSRRCKSLFSPRRPPIQCQFNI
jgi:hypothetical protein